MAYQTMLWPPRIGDRVGIRGGRLLGTVTRIDDAGGQRHYIVDVYPPSDTDAGSQYELTHAARVARTTYTLDELEAHPDSRHRG